jgi:hypothetical protein
MATPDKVFKQTYAWYKASIDRVSANVVPASAAPAVETMVWQVLGLLNAAAPPADPDISDFRDGGADAASLSVAVEVIGETLTALGYIKRAVDALDGGNPADALSVIGPVMQQIDRLSKLQPGSRYPSAFSIGKLLLMLSGDTDAEPAATHEADKLAALLGAVTPDDVANAQAALGIVALLIGSIIDRSFSAPTTVPMPDWVLPALPDFTGKPQFTIAGPGGIGGTVQLNPGPPSTLKAALSLAIDQHPTINGSDFTFGLTASAGVGVLVPILPPGPIQVSGDYRIDLTLSKGGAGGALTMGNAASGISLAIGELGVTLGIKNSAPALGFFARKVNASIKPDDGFLKLILGDGISLAFDIEAEADASGKLRLTNGTGLKASLPIPTLPTGPFELQLINFGLAPKDGDFTKLQVELSASFGIELGPFQGSVDRLGVLLSLDIGNGGAPIAFAFKPPNGIGLSLDVGIIAGGGYLDVDENGYAGVLELKMLAIDVKAIAILDTHSEAGFSLLLLIFGQFPAIQLSFGFTLTGVGGLIGVQHTVSTTALSAAVGSGSLNAVLFPDNPVANAPQIIATLRTLFPVKAGGFVIGPMLELGWGTPNLVTVQLGLLIEASQFTIVGRAVVQLPPIVSADLALLYLELDFAGYVVFDPLRIGFDAKLIHSRVAFISLTGQFAFRAQFGDQPTFLISAGGFHPRFKEIPADIPMPFDRVGCSFDIGVVGVSFKGYFAVTSATVQAGSDLKMWADIGIASIEGGYGFDAICYLVPKFYFEVDLHAYLAIHVFGLDFASVHLDGLLAGPGRWHVAAKASVHTPWPLPDFSLSIDESWGTDRDTPKITVNVAAALVKEIDDLANWSAQLPRGGESYITLANIAAGTDVLAHPLGTLVFQQKLVPLELRMDKASGSAIDGPNEFDTPALTLTHQDIVVTGLSHPTARNDFFAAAQFIEMSQDDSLAKPSFEPFAAGYELGDDGYALDGIVAAPLDYEEANLDPDPVAPINRRLAQDAFLADRHQALMRFGAAGLSTLRDKVITQPAQPTALQVNPPQVAVVDKVTTTVTAGFQTFTSVWKADRAKTANVSVPVKSLHVMELAELDA